MDVFDACAQIRADARPLKGKKCPGGYSIPANKQCGKGGRKVRSPGVGSNLNSLRLAGAVGLGGVAMYQADKIKREREARKASDRRWEDIHQSSRDTLGKVIDLSQKVRPRQPGP